MFETDRHFLCDLKRQYSHPCLFLRSPLESGSRFSLDDRLQEVLRRHVNLSVVLHGREFKEPFLSRSQLTLFVFRFAARKIFFYHSVRTYYVCAVTAMDVQKAHPPRQAAPRFSEKFSRGSLGLRGHHKIEERRPGHARGQGKHDEFSIGGGCGLRGKSPRRTRQTASERTLSTLHFQYGLEKRQLL